MNSYIKLVLQLGYVLIVLLFTPSVFASSITGGAMTLNIDADALAAAFTHDFDPNRPSFYLEEYFDSAQAASRTDAQLLNDHLVPGAGQISGIGRQFAVNGVSTTGANIANSFTFDRNDLTGTASNAIGLGGALRYRIDKNFVISDTGEETGNRAINAYLSLEYSADRVEGNHSGWVIFNNYSFRADVFDLDNVSTTLTGNSLILSGDLALASGFNHLGGEEGAIVGDFNFQTTVVPVPAAVWLFASSLAGLFVGRIRKVNR